jgi:hypothetical protein
MSYSSECLLETVDTFTEHKVAKAFDVSKEPESSSPIDKAQSKNGTISEVNLKDQNSDVFVKVRRCKSQQGNDLVKRQSYDQSIERREPRTSLHFSNNHFSSRDYVGFKKGNVVRGILCPSLTKSFR